MTWKEDEGYEAGSPLRFKPNVDNVDIKAGNG